MTPRNPMGSVVLVLALTCISSPFLAAHAPDQPIVCQGIVVAVEGEVAVERGGEPRSVTEGFVLLGSDVIILKTGAKCTAFAPSGEILRLEGPVEHLLPGPSKEGFLDSVAAWIREQLAQWAGRSRTEVLVVRAAPRDWEIQLDAPQQLIPAPGGRVRRASAGLRWGTIPGINSYLVTLVSKPGGEVSRLVQGGRLELADLVEGEEYVWDVQPSVSDWSAERSWRVLHVMTPEDEKLLDLALEGTDDLEAGVLLLCAGLHEEAIHRLDAAFEAARDARSPRLWRARAMSEIGLHAEACGDLEAIGAHE